MAFLLVKKRRMTRRRNREAREKREKRQRKPSRPIKSTCTCCGFRIKIFVINHAKRVYSLKQQATGGALKAKQTRANAPEEPPEGVRGGARARTACAAPTCRNTVGGPSELALQEGRRGVMMITRQDRPTPSQRNWRFHPCRQNTPKHLAVQRLGGRRAAGGRSPAAAVLGQPMPRPVTFDIY